MRSTTISLSLALGAVTLTFGLAAAPAWAQAQTGTPARVQGKAPTNPALDLDADDESVKDLLTTVSDDAKWDLVIAAPDSMVRPHLTLKLHRKPALEALNMVLEASGLAGEFSGDVLTVRPGPAASSAPLAGRIEQGREASPDEAAHMPGVWRSHNREQDERVAFGEALLVEQGETVRSVVAIGGPLTVRGHVREDAVAIGGDLVAEPGARIDGDAVAIGGKLDLRPGALVRGDRVNVGGPFGGVARVVSRAVRGDVSVAALLALSIFSALVRGLIVFIVALLLLTFVPERVQRVRTYLVENTGRSALMGLALLLGTLPLIALLCVTIVGIPLVPVVVVILLCLAALGLTALLTFIGDRLPLFVGRKTPLGAMLIGLVLFILVDLVPVLGVMLIFVASLVAAGAALLARFGSEPKAPSSTAGAASL
jgi:hypothetical protein